MRTADTINTDHVVNTNVGSVDRAVRIIVGLALLSLVFVFHGSGRWVGLIGLVPLLRASFGICPLHTVLGVNTCPATPKRP